MSSMAHSGQGSAGASVMSEGTTRLSQYKSKAMASDDIRRRCEDYNIQLRKQRKEEHLAKRRSGLAETTFVRLVENNDAGSGGAAASVVSDKGGGGGLGNTRLEGCDTSDIPTASKLQIELGGMSQLLLNGSEEVQFQILNRIRRILSTDLHPPIDDVINANLLPVLVAYLERPDSLEMQFEAAWALTNLASGTSVQTECIVAAGAVPPLIALLDNPHPQIQEQALWALGNIAGDGEEMRDFVLGQGIVSSLLRVLQPAEKFQPRLTLLRYAVWCLSNLARGKYPRPNFYHLSPTLPALSPVLFIDDPDLLTDACWTINCLADGTDEQIQAVLDAGLARGLVRLLAHPQLPVVTAALRALGSLATGDDIQTQVLLNSGLLPCLGHLLTTAPPGHREALRKDICWTLSNVTAGNKKQIQAVIDSDLAPLLIEVLTKAEFKTRKEAAWAICNALTGGSPDQIDYLVQEGCLPPLVRLTTVMDARVVMVALSGVERILRVGQTVAKQRGLSCNPYALLLEECGGLDQIEYLQSHENGDIYLKSFEIIDHYLSPIDDATHQSNSTLASAAAVANDMRSQEGAALDLSNRNNSDVARTEGGIFSFVTNSNPPTGGFAF